MPITKQHTEESLCFAHIYALAGIAGVNLAATRYDYGIDGTFISVVNRGSRKVDSGFPLDFQAKATINWERDGDKIVYDLEAKTYNDLVSRTEAETSIILILLCLPQNRSDWHATTPDQTILRHCCYWYTIDGDPTSNKQTHRIVVPSGNLLTPTSLQSLLAAERERRENQAL